MAFRAVQDAEKYCHPQANTDQKAIKSLWDRGQAIYMTEIAPITVLQTYGDKPYVKITTDSVEGPIYISRRTCDLLRWRRIPESRYAASDWIHRAYHELEQQDRTSAEKSLENAYHAKVALPAELAEALLLRAEVLETLKRSDEALLLLEELERRYWSATDRRVRAYTAEGVCENGFIQGRLKRNLEAVTAFDKVIDHFSKDSNLEVRTQIAIALVHKGIALCEIGCFRDAIVANERVLAEFEGTENIRIRRQIALALRNKAAALHRLCLLGEAIACCDQIVGRFGEERDPEIQEERAWSISFKTLLQAEAARPRRDE